MASEQSVALMDVISDVQLSGLPTALVVGVKRASMSGSLRSDEPEIGLAIYSLNPHSLFGMYRLQQARQMQPSVRVTQLHVKTPLQWTMYDGSAIVAEYEWLCCSEDGYYLQASDNKGNVLARTGFFLPSDLKVAFDHRVGDSERQYLSHNVQPSWNEWVRTQSQPMDQASGDSSDLATPRMRMA